MIPFSKVSILTLIFSSYRHKNVFLLANDGQYALLHFLSGVCLDIYICQPGEFCFNQRLSGFFGYCHSHCVVTNVHDRGCWIFIAREISDVESVYVLV